MTQLSPEKFAASFPERFQRSAFRLEQLDIYVAPNEREPFRRFLAGQPQNPAWREPWKKLVRAALRDGKRMARVHIVDEPLSDYLQFELTCVYPANVAAGEDVRILPRNRWPWLPDHDFWLFDGREVAAMTYDENGNWISVEATRDLDAVESYCQSRTLAMKHSIPLTTYLGSLGLKEAV